MENKVQHKVEQYRTFLTASYERVQITKDQWPPVQFQEFIKLVTVEKLDDVTKEDICTEAMMNGNLAIVKRMKKSIEMEKIGRFEDGTLASCIIVEGIPGVGKSTLAWQLGRRWGKKEILQHFQLVIVLHLRDERVQKARKISELLYHPNTVVREAVFEWISTTLGENVLLILDGYDELPSDFQIGDRSIFARIIKGEELPKLTVLVTSRPSANRNLYQLCRIQAKCQYIEVVGFDEKEIQEYIEHAFKHNIELMERFQLYIVYPHIHSLMYVPINCAIILELFMEHKGKPPQTLTELYTALTNTLLQRHEQKAKEKTPVGMTYAVDLLKKHYIDLVGTIQDPAGLAGSLYSRGIISKLVMSKVQQRGDLITKEKNEVLINAVEAQVTTDPSVFQMFMEVMEGEPSLSTIVEKMRGPSDSVARNKGGVTLSKMTCFEALSSTTLSQLQTVAKLAYQGTINDRLISHNVEDNIESLGLLQKVPQLYSTSSPKASYNFVHKTLQEFLTAWYVSSLPTSEQRVFVKDSITKPHMAMTVRFMAGLSKFQTSSKDIYDWASIVMPVGKQISIENLHWVFETENPTFIQKLMGNKEQTFYCFCTSLNPCDLYVLVYCIVNSSTKWSVNLTSRDMTDKCMKMLFLVEEGKAFHHITSLKLSGNTILTSIASLLGMMLKEKNTLKELDLCRCGLQSEGLEEVIKGVQVNTRLETLDLSENTIDDMRASCLGMMLKENTTLKQLYLRYCGLQPDGLEDVIKGVQVNTKLETLVLSENTIDNQRASYLGMILKENNTLKQLDLRDSTLQPAGLEEVIKGIEVNTKLENLRLSDNTIDKKTASCLVTRRRCPTHALKHNTTLSDLRLRWCDLRDEAIGELCGGLKLCKLKTLELVGNEFGDQGARGLADVLKDHPTLEVLNVYGCGEMSGEGVKCLTDVMMSNTRVKMLALSEKYKPLVPQKLVNRIKYDGL